MSITYTLNYSGDLPEIERLEWNHFHLLVPMLEFLLPPDVIDHLKAISAGEEGKTSRSPAVADIATGTGVWLADLAQQLPANTHLIGVDMTAAKFRSTEALPANVRLYEADMLQPFAAEHLGAYDVVHVRLVRLALRDADWELLVQNLMSLLRPGGLLVWEDVSKKLGHVTVNKMVEQSRVTPGVVQDIIRFNEARGIIAPYPVGLERLLQTFGCTDTIQKTYSMSDFWEDPNMYRTSQWVAYKVVETCLLGIVGAGGFEHIQTAEDAERLNEVVKQELMSGMVRMDVTFWRTMARKPVA